MSTIATELEAYSSRFRHAAGLGYRHKNLQLPQLEPMARAMETIHDGRNNKKSYRYQNIALQTYSPKGYSVTSLS